MTNKYKVTFTNKSTGIASPAIHIERDTEAAALREATNQFAMYRNKPMDFTVEIEEVTL